MFIHTINVACLPLAPNEIRQELDEIAMAIRLNHLGGR
jgi:hypothetical protein